MNDNSSNSCDDYTIELNEKHMDNKNEIGHHDDDHSRSSSSTSSSNHSDNSDKSNGCSSSDSNNSSQIWKTLHSWSESSEESEESEESDEDQEMEIPAAVSNTNSNNKQLTRIMNGVNSSMFHHNEEEIK